MWKNGISWELCGGGSGGFHFITLCDSFSDTLG